MSEKGAKTPDCQWRVKAMEHSMAVRANGDQIRNRINLVLVVDRGERDHVMDMDEILADGAIG
jgi:hypothetical protein